MRQFTLFIAAFVATLAVAQAQKVSKTDWSACKTTKDCTSKGFVCTPSPQSGSNICVNQNQYPDATKDGDCTVPWMQPNNAQNTYTCPFYFNASSPTIDWGFCLNTTQCNKGFSCAPMPNDGGALCVNTSMYAGQTMGCNVPRGMGIAWKYQDNHITCPDAPPLRKWKASDWNLCNTTSQCGAGWSCADMPDFKINGKKVGSLCVQNSLYTGKTENCNVPAYPSINGLYVYNTITCPEVPDFSPALSLVHSAFKKGTQEYCVEINGADVTNAKVGTALSKMGGTHLASGGCQAGDRTAAITKSAFGNTFTLFLV